MFFAKNHNEAFQFVSHVQSTVDLFLPDTIYLYHDSVKNVALILMTGI